MAATGDRRPIAARSLRPVIAVADWLVRRRASPNGISVAGMVAAMVAGLAFALTFRFPHAAPALWILGAVLIQLRLFANMMDGMVAVGRNIASPVGELFNEVPDRVSDTAVLVGFGVAAGSWALGMAAALAAMATAYVRALGKAAGAPSEFCGPMAKQQRMFLVTIVAVAAAVPGLVSRDVLVTVLWVITVLAAGTAGRRLARTNAALKARA